jgi:hypothetical protein
VQLSELTSRARPFAPLVVIAAAVVAGFARGLGVALLVLAGGMLLLAIGFLWESVQSLGDEADLTLDEALALAAPSAEEEKKRAVLRALKDLEFERSVGKVSEEDFKKLSAQYREEAKLLLQVLDREQSPARERAEKLAESYLEKALKDAPPPKTAEDEPAETEEADDVEDEDEDEDEDDVSELVCAQCDTKNDTDARFCKKCGEALS